ncbi:MAG: DNA helicase UvrD, partial [bacterium]|nr:DNA helicase UvrD [bacterium]
VRFILSGEISSIYKKNDKVRKIHNVIFAPTLEAVEKIQVALEKIGNNRSDGRPILGLDARNLLEIILDIDPQAHLIPAHIWTPWFSLLGSKSGFDSVEQCFEDLTPHIFALETGLSSDPPMNWRISALDRYTLVSNSDAHSPQKLAREANLFNTELSYPAIFKALKTGDPESFLGTIEFFPEEGKYHYDGHRKCSTRWHPKTTLTHNGLCSQCGKGVTIGVMHRVETLADREEGQKAARQHPFYSLIPLPEILSEVYGVGPNSKRVKQGYETLLAKLGPELSILQAIPPSDIGQVGGALLAEGIQKMRRGEVTTAAGYDGQFGVIKLFEKQERSSFLPQLSLFTAEKKKAIPKRKKTKPDRQPPMPALNEVASNEVASNEIASNEIILNEAKANSYEVGQTPPPRTQ